MVYRMLVRRVGSLIKMNTLNSCGIGKQELGVLELAGVLTQAVDPIRWRKLNMWSVDADKLEQWYVRTMLIRDAS